MRNFYKSFEELLGCCSNSTLKGHVSSVLARGKWELLSCFDDGDLCRSEFVAPVTGSDLVHYFVLVAGPFGTRGYMDIREAGVKDIV